MKALFFAAVMMISTQAFAQKGDKAVSGVLGFFGSEAGMVSESTKVDQARLSGFYGVGGDFEYFLDNDMSVGGILRYYTTTDTINSVDMTNTLTSLGGIIRVYLIDNTKWAAAATGGVGLTGLSVKTGTQTTDSGMVFGGYLGMQLQYKLNSTTRIGAENLRIMGLGDKLNGWILSDYVAKVTFFF